MGGGLGDYFRTQAKYDNGLHDPVTTFLMAFTGGPKAKYPLQDPNPGYQHFIPQAQTAFIAALVIGLIVWTLWRRPVCRCRLGAPRLHRRFLDRAAHRRPVPGALPNGGAAVPCVALCTGLPRVVQVALVGIAALLAVGLAQLFTQYLIY